ncbi:MAG TPA: hypothetical protein VL992_05475 [Tepidisphaeraceae bacterium]|nr:hypothetical protein [Tepidisphaeraceae bacterium]
MKVTRFTLVHLLVIVALIALATALALPAIERARDKANLLLCRDHLRQIGVDLAQYAKLNRGCYPAGQTIDGPQVQLVKSLAAAGLIGDPRDFYCPAQRQPDRCYSQENFNAGVIGYYYFSALAAGKDSDLSQFLRSGALWPRKIVAKMDPGTWVMSDLWVSGAETAHRGYRKGVNYLLLDGSVNFIGQSPRQAFH